MNLLDFDGVSFAYPGRPVLKDVSFGVGPGEIVGLAGPNGSGKSTLLLLGIGALKANGGTVRLGGAPVAALDRREIARRAAYVPQEVSVPFSFSVREIVEMGRFPHLGRFQPEGAADVEAVRRALEATETAGLAERPVNELSGGERQRVFLARAMAQEPALYVLDEPTANLDLVHQLEAMLLVRWLAAQGKGVIVALHDLSLASRFCHRIVLLSEGTVAAQGRPAEVVTEENLARHFGIRAKVSEGEASEGLRIVPVEPVAKGRIPSA